MNDQVEVAASAPVYKAPKDHNELKRMVEQNLDITRENATLCRRDRDYYDGDQISDSVKAVLAKRKQPLVKNNMIRSAVNGLYGLIDGAATDPEAYPRNVSSQDAADLVTKTLRYLADRGNYKKVRALASENFLIQGTCGAVLEFTGKHVSIERIRWEDFVYDPLSRDHDFGDSKYLGVAKMLDNADVEAMFPDTFAALGSPTGDFNDFFDDKSKSRYWATAKRDRLRVVDLYYEVGGEWHRGVFCDSGMLFAGPSEYHDDMGISFCPIVGASYESKQNGDRYGVVRDMIELQDGLNSNSSRMLHLVNSRQTRQTDMYAPSGNKEIARAEAAKADGVLPFGYETLQTQDLISGQMQMIQQSMTDLQRMAPTPAALGRASFSGQSGRSQQLMQQAGNTETARGFGRFEEFELSIYRKMWLIAKEWLDQPTMIRILDDPKAIEFLQINEPVMGPTPTPIMDPATGQPMVDPATGQPRIQMQMGVVGMKNRIAELDMDIILTTVPDSITLAHETFATILDYAKGAGISPLDPSLSAIIEMSPMPDKRNVLDRIKRIGAEMAQQAAPQQEAAAQAAQQQSQVATDLQKAKTAKDQAHAEKATAEAERTTLENHAFVAAAAQHVATNYPAIGPRV